MLGAIPSRFLMWILLLQWIYLLWNAYVSTKVFDTLLMPIYLNFRCSFWLLYRVVNAMLGEGCWEWFWDSKMLSLLVTLEIPNLTSLRDSLQEGHPSFPLEFHWTQQFWISLSNFIFSSSSRFSTSAETSFEPLLPINHELIFMARSLYTQNVEFGSDLNLPDADRRGRREKKVRTFILRPDKRKSLSKQVNFWDIMWRELISVFTTFSSRWNAETVKSRLKARKECSEIENLFVFLSLEFTQFGWNRVKLRSSH